MSTGHHPSIFERKLDFDAYVIDEPLLGRLDELARTLLIRTHGDALKTAYVASGPEAKMFHFSSLQALVEHFSKSRDSIGEMSVEYRSGEDRILLSFPKGRVRTQQIRLVAFGKVPDIDFVVESFANELQHAAAPYHWLTRTLGINSMPKWILALLIPIISIYLLFQVVYYVHATRIGVDVDAALLSPGNTHFKDVERAIKSASVNEKLDVILKGEFRYFNNVSNVLAETRSSIITMAVVLVVLSLVSLCLRAYSKACPRTFFSIGLAREQWQRLERTREFWRVGVVIAFVINVLAGLAVALVVS